MTRARVKLLQRLCILIDSLLLVTVAAVAAVTAVAAVAAVTTIAAVTDVATVATAAAAAIKELFDVSCSIDTSISTC